MPRVDKVVELPRGHEIEVRLFVRGYYRHATFDDPAESEMEAEAEEIIWSDTGRPVKPRCIKEKAETLACSALTWEDVKVEREYDGD